MPYREGLLVGRPPAQWRAELVLEDPRPLAIAPEAVELRLAEDLLTLEIDLDPALAARPQLDAGDHRSPMLQQLVSQAHGLVEVVSRDAEFNCYLRFCAGHL